MSTEPAKSILIVGAEVRVLPQNVRDDPRVAIWTGKVEDIPDGIETCLLNMGMVPNHEKQITAWNETVNAEIIPLDSSSEIIKWFRQNSDDADAGGETLIDTPRFLLVVSNQSIEDERFSELSGTDGTLMDQDEANGTVISSGTTTSVIVMNDVEYMTRKALEAKAKKAGVPYHEPINFHEAEDFVETLRKPKNKKEDKPPANPPTPISPSQMSVSQAARPETEVRVIRKSIPLSPISPIFDSPRPAKGRRTRAEPESNLQPLATPPARRQKLPNTEIHPEEEAVSTEFNVTQFVVNHHRPLKEIRDEGKGAFVREAQRIIGLMTPKQRKRAKLEAVKQALYHLDVPRTQGQTGNPRPRGNGGTKKAVGTTTKWEYSKADFVRQFVKPTFNGSPAEKAREIMEIGKTRHKLELRFKSILTEIGRIIDSKKHSAPKAQPAGKKTAKKRLSELKATVARRRSGKEIPLSEMLEGIIRSLQSSQDSIGDAVSGLRAFAPKLDELAARGNHDKAMERAKQLAGQLQAALETK